MIAVQIRQRLTRKHSSNVHPRHPDSQRVPAGRRLDDPLSLAWNVRLIVVEDQMRLAACEVEQHLREVAVRPREPRAGVRAVVDVDRLVDETETCSVLQSYA